MDEITYFALTGDHTAWWIPGDYDTTEFIYTTSKLSEVNTGITSMLYEINTRVPWSETILPFTRLMAGPMDYTPGIFEIKTDYYKPGAKEQVDITLAKQLALYITLYSPLQMATDLPENYEKRLDALLFIKDVAVDWDRSLYLDAEHGDFLSIVRKAKGKNERLGGAITDENARMATFKLDFPDKAIQWEAIIYKDGKDTDWGKKPHELYC